MIDAVQPRGRSVRADVPLSANTDRLLITYQPQRVPGHARPLGPIPVPLNPPPLPEDRTGLTHRSVDLSRAAPRPCAAALTSPVLTLSHKQVETRRRQRHSPVSHGAAAVIALKQKNTKTLIAYDELCCRANACASAVIRSLRSQISLSSFFRWENQIHGNVFSPSCRLP